MVILQLTNEQLSLLVQQAVQKVITNAPQTDSLLKDTDEHLTVKEAAEYLNLSVPTIYNLACKHKLPVNKPSGSKRLYFSKQELTEWIKSGRKKTLQEITNEAGHDLLIKNKRR